MTGTESAGMPGLTPTVHTSLVATGNALPLASRENWIVMRCAATFLPFGCLIDTVMLEFDVLLTTCHRC